MEKVIFVSGEKFFRFFLGLGEVDENFSGLLIKRKREDIGRFILVAVKLVELVRKGG